MFSANDWLSRLLRMGSWSPFEHVVLVFKGPLQSEKSRGLEAQYKNKLRIFQATFSHYKTDVKGIRTEKDGVNLYDFDEVLANQRLFGAKAYVCKLNCSNQSEKRKLLDEKMAIEISNHIDEEYAMEDLVQCLAGKSIEYFNKQGESKHRWACSTIIAEIFKQAGIFKNNVNLYSFFPGSYSSTKLDVKCCFVKGMNLGIEQKLIYH